MQTENRVLSTHQAAEILGIHKRTLDNWRSLGRGPAYLKYSGKKIGYLMDDLESFRQMHRIEPVNN